MAAGRFRVAALAWAAARSGVRPSDPATVATRSWASRTTQRYQGSLFAVADFEDECSLPTGPSTCLSEYLSAKMSSGVARSTLRNVASAVRGAEDLGIMPPTVLPIHWRLAKGGLSSGRQPYFSPPALSFLAQAARTREQRVALGLGCLSYVLWLRVSEAATIAPRDLQASGMASFTATKWGGRRKRDARWAAGRLAGLLISWLWWVLQRTRRSRSRSEDRQGLRRPSSTCCGTHGGAICDGTRSGRVAVRRATTGVPTYGSSYGGGVGDAFKQRSSTPPGTPIRRWWGPFFYLLRMLGTLLALCWRFRFRTFGRRQCTRKSPLPSRTWSRDWASHLLPASGSQRGPAVVRAASPPVPLPRTLPRSRPVHPSSRPGQRQQPRSAVVECPHPGPTRVSATTAHLSSAANPLQGAGHVEAGPSASGARLAPRLPSQRAGTRALNRHQSGGGCRSWALPYVSTALYRVARRWCWVVAPAGVVPPPGAVYVGVAPTGVRAPLVVPKRCLGGGRGPKYLARWENRQGAWLSPVGWRGSSDRAARTGATQSPYEDAASRGARRGPGLSDRLAGGPEGPPNNHNGGSPADPGVPRPGGMLGPRNVRGQSPPGPVVQPDGPRPPLFSGGWGNLFSCSSCASCPVSWRGCPSPSKPASAS